MSKSLDSVVQLRRPLPWSSTCCCFRTCNREDGRSRDREGVKGGIKKCQKWLLSCDDVGSSQADGARDDVLLL